jgi:hypothetical protein
VKKDVDPGRLPAFLNRSGQFGENLLQVQVVRDFNGKIPERLPSDIFGIDEELVHHRLAEEVDDLQREGEEQRDDRRPDDLVRIAHGQHRGDKIVQIEPGEGKTDGKKRADQGEGQSPGQHKL